MKQTEISVALKSLQRMYEGKFQNKKRFPHSRRASLLFRGVIFENILKS